MDGEGKRKKRLAAARRILALLRKKGKKTKKKTKKAVRKGDITQTVNVVLGKAATGARGARGTSSARGSRKGSSSARGSYNVTHTYIGTPAPAPPAPAKIVVEKPHPGREHAESKDIIPAWKPGMAVPDGSRYYRSIKGADGKQQLLEITDDAKALGRAIAANNRAAKEAVQKAESEAKKAKVESKKEREEKHAKEADLDKERAAKAEEKKSRLKAETERDEERDKGVKASRAAREAEYMHRFDGMTMAQLESEYKKRTGSNPPKALRKKSALTAELKRMEKRELDRYRLIGLDAVDDRWQQELLDLVTTQGGMGRDRDLTKTPLSSEEIEKLMSKVPGFQGAVPSDNSFNVHGNAPETGVSWVMNLDKTGEPGSHWVAVLITPHSVEYSNSFGDDPSPQVQERIVAAGKRIWPENKRKTLKINRVKRQDERTVDCGYHAMKFIHDRLSGKSFIDATGYNAQGGQVRKSEAEVKQFAHEYPRFVKIDQVGKGILDHPGDNMPLGVKAMLERHGKEQLTSLEVVRTGVHAAISQVLNVVSLGAFKEAVRRYGYDNLFHLAINVNGRYKIEKNATVHFTDGTRSEGERKTAPVRPGTTVEDLFKRGGSAGFWLYDPRTNNCQDFVATVLSGVGSLTPELRAFVKQDAEGIFRSNPAYVGKLAKLVTDIGGRVDGAKDKAKSFLGRLWQKVRGRGQRGGFGLPPEELARYNENLAKNYTAEGQYKDLGKGDINRFLVDGQQPSNYGDKTHRMPSTSFGGKIGDFFEKLWRKVRGRGRRRRQRGGMLLDDPGFLPKIAGNPAIGLRKPLLRGPLAFKGPRLAQSGGLYGATISLPWDRPAPSTRRGPPVLVL